MILFSFPQGYVNMMILRMNLPVAKNSMKLNHKSLFLGSKGTSFDVWSEVICPSKTATLPTSKETCWNETSHLKMEGFSIFIDLFIYRFLFQTKPRNITIKTTLLLISLYKMIKIDALCIPWGGNENKSIFYVGFCFCKQFFQKLHALLQAVPKKTSTSLLHRRLPYPFLEFFFCFFFNCRAWVKGFLGSGFPSTANNGR